MEDIVQHIRESLVDDQLSKDEKRTLKAMVVERALDQDQLNFLRSKAYEIANEKATATNFRLIIEWLRTVTNALILPVPELSTAYFSPGESCRDLIIRQINQSIKCLHICVFTISDDRITEAIMTAHKRKIDIRIITDNDKSMDVGSDIDRLTKFGLAVKMDNSPNHMHHKFMVIDERSVLTGSYNWTQSAARYNFENIVLTRETGVVRSFLKEFEKLWKEMEVHRF